jgi:hypothetical protein
VNDIYLPTYTCVRIVRRTVRLEGWLVGWLFTRNSNPSPGSIMFFSFQVNNSSK